MTRPPATAPQKPAQSHILVVDDDARLRDLLRQYLSDNGFRVSVAADAEEARAAIGNMEFDLIVLDLMLPGESGLDLARGLRTESAIPILMLTAMGEPSDRIQGLEFGADDYLTKPFEPRELILRLRTILRRAGPPSEPRRLIRLGAMVFDPDRRELRQGDSLIGLTETEAVMLAVLAAHPGQTVDRERLQHDCGIGGSDRAVDVQVTRLRRKIERDPRLPRYLKTVRGHGYVLWTD
ncbi:MAG: response regulator [Alphaproteobacteria bacterium]